MHEDYVEFLINFRFDPNQVHILQVDGNLDIKINGLWKEAILWEVPLMAAISEIYCREFEPIDIHTKTVQTAIAMKEYDIKFIDFGTRRRFS